MPQGVGYGGEWQVDSDAFPNAVRDREQLSQMWAHIAQVLSDNVRSRAVDAEPQAPVGQMEGGVGMEQAGMPGEMPPQRPGLPPISEWAGAPRGLEEHMADSSGYVYADGEVSPFSPDGAPERNTMAREFRIGDNQIAEFALTAGFSEEQAVTAVAIALAESAGSTAAVGDAHLRNEKWGASIGLWQIRTLNDPEKYGSRSDLMRDFSRLFDPEFNARAAFEISGRGRNWSPWTVYKTGAYEQYLGRARQAVQDAMSAMQIEGAS